MRDLVSESVSLRGKLAYLIDAHGIGRRLISSPDLKRRRLYMCAPLPDPCITMTA